MNNKKRFTVSEKFERNLVVGLTTTTLVFVNVCLPALMIGTVLYFIFWR